MKIAHLAAVLVLVSCTAALADAERIKKLEEKSAAGDAQATYDLAIALQFGVETKRDLDKALKLLEKAAAENHIQALDHLGDMYNAGDYGVPIDMERAVKYFRKEIDAGGAWGYISLGNAYESGDGVPKDEDEAQRLYKRGAEVARAGVDKKNAYDHFALANCYRNGEGIKSDLANALELYLIAAKLGDPWCLTSIGTMYETGEGVPQNYDEARKWYEKAAAAGVCWGMTSLANLYEQGNGVEKDLNKAAEHYLKAAESGSAQAMSSLAHLYLDELGEPKKGIEWLIKAADRNEYRSTMTLVDRCLAGKDVPQDHAKAIELLKKAAKTHEDAKEKLRELGETE